MIKHVLLTFLILATMTEFAVASYNDFIPFRNDVVTPTVPNVSSVSDQSVGMLIFDASDNQFKGLDQEGNWRNLTSSERFERIRFGGSTEPSKCTTSPCTIYSQSGSWVESVTLNTVTKQYTLNIEEGIFSEMPTCTCSAIDPNISHQSCEVTNLGSATEIVITATNVGTSGVNEGYFNVICVGPR